MWWQVTNPPKVTHKMKIGHRLECQEEKAPTQYYENMDI